MIERLCQAVDFRGADGMLDGGPGSQILFGIGVDITGLRACGEQRLTTERGKNGLRGFQMAEVVRSV